VVAALAFLLAGTALAGYGVVARLLPSPDELQARASQFSSTLIYDREGNLLNEQGDPNYGRRRAVPLEQISQYLIDATLATEDPHFYQHPGVDPVGIARALYYAIKDRDFSSGPGGSTITQQLVKLTYLSPERTISRKMKEAILAAEITRRYPKDTVLAMYLNELNYGNLAYGIEAAAETYFGKRATDLTLAEAAMLAGLPQAPAYYDPYTRLWEADGKPGPVKERQGDVLRLMVENDYITQQQSDAAWQEELELQPLKQVYSLKHPHFVQFARTEVESVLGPELAAKGGLRIYTTLDPRVQAIAEEEVAAQVKKLAGQGAANGATVAMRPTTGELLAMVGSADFNSEAISGQINMAVAPRQPGSALKPFTYLAAFEMPAAVKDANPPTAGPNPTPGGPDPITAIEPPGYWTPSTALMDVVTQFPDGANPPYVPTNYDDREHGLVTVRTALANSLNIPAVKALEHAGLERFKNVARRVGITTLTGDDYGLALTLGGGDVNLLELTGAYAVLANGGVRVPSSTIACVVDAAGKPLWVGAGAPQVQACQQAAAKGGQPAVRPAAARPAVDPQHAYLITSILADREARRPMFGAVADLLGLPDRSAAAKTGTSNDYRDAWTIGYTPDLAVGAWVGNADYTPMKKIAGSVGAAPIWHNVMRRSLDGQPGAAFTQPPGIQRIQVCADTGTLPSPACSRTSEEVFAAGQGPLPAGYDLHQRVRVDRVTGLPATEFTPPDRVEERDVMAFPPKYQEWAAAHGYPVLNVPPPQYAFPPDLDLREPPNDMTVSGLTPVLGRARVPAPLVWRLEYGVGPNPIGWGVLTDFRTDEIDGVIGEWDSEQTAAQHDTGDFSLRLAAYDPANMDYPVAVSAASYTHVAPPRPEPEATFTSEPTPSPTETPPIATPAPSSTPTPLPSASPTLGAPTPTPALTPTPGVTPNPEITPTVTAPVASPLVAALLSPVDGAEVTGQVQISGIAEGPGFTGYELEFAPEGPTGEPVWTPVGNPGLQPVSGGPLAVWDTTALEPGTYRLRLRAYDALGAMATSDVRVQVVRGN
jgi:membrane peptidoglycan carboxypeptidase